MTLIPPCCPCWELGIFTAWSSLSVSLQQFSASSLPTHSAVCVPPLLIIGPSSFLPQPLCALWIPLWGQFRLFSWPVLCFALGLSFHSFSCAEPIPALMFNQAGSDPRRHLATFSDWFGFYTWKGEVAFGIQRMQAKDVPTESTMHRIPVRIIHLKHQQWLAGNPLPCGNWLRVSMSHQSSMLLTCWSPVPSTVPGP